MIKKKILSTGAAAIIAISYFGTSSFADSKTDFKNSMEINMTVDADGNAVYEYTDAKGVTRTNGTTSKELTKGRYDYIYGILKMDSDNIVVTVTDAPKVEKHLLKLLVSMVELLLLLEQQDTVKVVLGVQRVSMEYLV